MGSGYYFISFLGAVHGSVLGSLFFRKKWNNTASKLLGIYVSILSLGLFERFAAEYFNESILKNTITGFLASSSLLYGPLLYLFIDYIVNGNPEFKRKHLLHFIPFIANYITFFLPVNFGNKDIGDLVDLLCYELFIVQILWYSIAAARKLKKHRGEILNYYSTLDGKNYRWLYQMLAVIIFIYTISFILTHLLLFGIQAASRLYILVQFAITVCIYILGYKILLQPHLFDLSKRVEPVPVSPGIPKYVRSGLRREDAEKLITVIKSYMENNKPYLNPDFSLDSFSGDISLSRNYITELLNTYFGRNFYEFVNEYRVEEAKSLMNNKDNDVLTLAAIGSKAGFQSKTAFNANFKKMTGLTPTDWKRLHSKK